MLVENKNLKNSQTDTDANSNSHASSALSLPILDGSQNMSYTKINKLITALYMVTDIMDKEEIIRNKLRTAGANIISDINLLTNKHANEARSLVSVMKGRITEIVNFMDIASSVGMISEMNKNILKKEFGELYNSMTESSYNQEVSISDFFENEEENNFLPTHQHPHPTSPLAKGEGNFSKGQMFQRHPFVPVEKKQNGTRIGVQNGHTLLKAISDMKTKNSNSVHSNSPHNNFNKHPLPTSPLAKGEERSSFDQLKKQRREDIISIIKNNKKNFPNTQGLTIKDIKDTKHGVLVSCGEKTLQRELVSMVKDGVLKKAGEKRWSHYFLSN